jgi:hypothetical protein
MQIHCNNPIRTCNLNGIGTYPCPDGHPGFILFIALGITEVRHHHSNGFGAGASEGVDPEEKFHEIIIGGKGGGLNQIHLPAAHILANPHKDVALGKAINLAFAFPDAKVSAYAGSQLFTGAPAEYHHFRFFLHGFFHLNIKLKIFKGF